MSLPTQSARIKTRRRSRTELFEPQTTWHASSSRQLSGDLFQSNAEASLKQRSVVLRDVVMQQLRASVFSRVQHWEVQHFVELIPSSPGKRHCVRPVEAPLPSPLGSFSRLPDELLLHVLMQLDNNALASIARCSKELNAICQDDELYRLRCERLLCTNCDQIQRPLGVSWRQLTEYVLRPIAKSCSLVADAPFAHAAQPTFAYNGPAHVAPGGAMFEFDIKDRLLKKYASPVPHVSELVLSRSLGLEEVGFSTAMVGERLVCGGRGQQHESAILVLDSNAVQQSLFALPDGVCYHHCRFVAFDDTLLLCYTEQKIYLLTLQGRLVASCERGADELAGSQDWTSLVVVGERVYSVGDGVVVRDRQLRRLHAVPFPIFSTPDSAYTAPEQDILDCEDISMQTETLLFEVAGHVIVLRQLMYLASDTDGDPICQLVALQFFVPDLGRSAMIPVPRGFLEVCNVFDRHGTVCILLQGCEELTMVCCNLAGRNIWTQVLRSGTDTEPVSTYAHIDSVFLRYAQKLCIWA